MGARLLEIVQWLDSNGDPLSGGKVHTFEAGTSTPKSAFTDQAAATAHANPVVLDSAGRAQIWLQGAPYKLRVDDANDVTIITLDQVQGTNVLLGDPRGVRNTVSTTVSASNGAASIAATGLIPANSRVINVLIEVTTAFGASNGLTGINVGGFGQNDRWGSNIALVLGTKTNIGNFQHDGQPVTATAVDVTLYALGGTFDTVGAATVEVEYEQSSL